MDTSFHSKIEELIFDATTSLVTGSDALVVLAMATFHGFNPPVVIKSAAPSTRSGAGVNLPRLLGDHLPVW